MDAEQLFLTLAELRERAPDDAAYEAAVAALMSEMDGADADAPPVESRPPRPA